VGLDPVEPAERQAIFPERHFGTRTDDYEKLSE
jgi:hypothetical protein